jgi:HNH endonuclease
MPKMTPGLAKNHIRRALRAIVDPEPNDREIADLWDFFGASCAYCGQPLSKKDRLGHIDHLIPGTRGGTNGVYNRVLACPACNGDEKREKDWLEFLQEKAGDPVQFESRRGRIESWRALHIPSALVVSSELLNQEIERVVAAFDASMARLRAERLKRQRELLAKNLQGEPQ